MHSIVLAIYSKHLPTDRYPFSSAVARLALLVDEPVTHNTGILRLR